jgi:hypothetical protein
VATTSSASSRVTSSIARAKSATSASERARFSHTPSPWASRNGTSSCRTASERRPQAPRLAAEAK